MPLVSRTFDQLIDFTRTSSATFVGSNGLIQSTPQSRNLLTFTQEFDNAAWTKTNTTVTANSTTAPDGTSTADTLTASASAGSGQQIYQALTSIASGNYVYSIYAKQGSGATDSNVFTVRNQTTGVNAASISFDYGTGVVTQISGYGATAANVGGGWWRLSIPFTLTATLGNAIRFYAGSTGAVETPGEFIYVWGAQLEAVPDANLVLGSELRGGGVVSTLGSPSPIATYNTSTGEATLNRVDGSNVSGVQVPVGGAGRPLRLSVTISAATAVVQVRGSGVAGTIIGTVGSTAGTYVLYVVSDTTDIYFVMGANAATATITINSVKEITGTVGMPSDYTRNYGGLFPPRFDYDPVTLAPRGLLIEEQRTNLLLRSEEFDNAAWTKLSLGTGVAPVVTANAAISPDGTLDADLVVFDRGVGNTTSDRSVLSQAPTVVSATAYTGTIYIKAATAGDVGKQIAFRGVAGSGYGIITLAADWTRVSRTETSAGTSGNFELANRGTVTADNTVSVHIWGAQLEAGAFATSYIPTVASQVTRTADNALIQAPNFAPWYNQSEGTFVVEADTFSPTGGFTQAVNDATANNRIAQALGTVGTSLITTGGASQFNQSIGSLTIGNPVKLAIAFKTNDTVSAVNGTIGVVDTSVTLPTVSRLSIGENSVNASYLNGHIRSIRYYPVRLSDAQLQALSA